METTNALHTENASLLHFDPIVLLRDVAKQWLVIVLVSLVVGVGSYIITDLQYVPVYQTNTTFVVTTRSSSNTVYTNLASTTSLAEVFTELLNSSILRKAIVQEMGVSSFHGTINTAVVPNTNLITMSVTDSDPRMAFLATRAIIENHEALTYQVVSDIQLEVLQNPVVPYAPTNQTGASEQMLRMMFLTALATAVLLASMSYLRDVVRSATEVREKLECDFLGEIPHEKKYKTLSSRVRKQKSSILMTNPITDFRFVESIRKLHRRVEQHMGNSKVLMVTSLLENEGKSTVAVNLALAMEQKQKRVLLIDCDLRKPACHMVLEQEQFSFGLNNVLHNTAELSDCFLRYQETDMYMLLAKKGERNTGDLIVSQQMKTMLNWARQNFDFIVLDLPPMSVAADAESMADLADACLMVIRQNMAFAPELNNAIGNLERHRAKMLGCVLNNVFSTQLSSGHSYGYGGYSKHRYYSHYGTSGSRGYGK